MKIGYLGAGTWGTALAALLSQNNHTVIVWDRDSKLIKTLKETRVHPKLNNFKVPNEIIYTDKFEEAVLDVDMIVESVTSLGLRDVFSRLMKITKINCPIVITSKGIEQKTDLLFPEVLLEILGEENKKYIGCLSGPSHAEEVIKKLPTSVVCSSYNEDTMMKIANAFNGPYFRVYPNSDILGVSFGGALKNIMAIACGISDGLGFGDNTKAALMTRGLHEMKKLSITKNADSETLNGLSGLGDLCVTCLSTFSRNYRFGRLIAKNLSLDEAKEKIGMVVEGAYTCIAALELAKKHNIPVPITQAVNAILYEKLEAKNVVKLLLQREIKEESK
ncbi:MAG: Glycerol-3-phosphate dehydrogenase [NAD(P)+] [Candidatus Anoxychlamydiales bacterium]|nr:Glycerol-3-phosphate dehydrogenase [NAD(P)+] [Candidatus Anoxychlamydiales bacterium]